MSYKSEAFCVYLDSQKVWEYLETGRNVDDLYPDHFKTENLILEHSKWLDTLMLENEEYIVLEELGYDYAVTSLGRVFNCKKKSHVKTYFSKNYSSILLRDIKIPLDKLFSELGWHYDYDVMFETFRNNGWKHTYFKDETEKLKQRVKQLG